MGQAGENKQLVLDRPLNRKAISRFQEDRLHKRVPKEMRQKEKREMELAVGQKTPLLTITKISILI